MLHSQPRFNTPVGMAQPLMKANQQDRQASAAGAGSSEHAEAERQKLDGHTQAGREGANGQADADGAGPSGQTSAGWEEQLLSSLTPAEVLARAARPRYPPQQLQFLQMLAAKDPAILASFGATPQVCVVMASHV